MDPVSRQRSVPLADLNVGLEGLKQKKIKHFRVLQLTPSVRPRLLCNV